MNPATSTTGDLELLLRRIIREEAGITPAVPAEKWRGGTLVLRPGAEGQQSKSWPIETFFHKIVMVRNRLRTLEQQVNASDLAEDVKVKLQSYVSRLLRIVDELQVLFADDADQFKGSEPTRKNSARTRVHPTTAGRVSATRFRRISGADSCAAIPRGSSPSTFRYLS